jgi:K+-transporting ATPase ATPase A chain
LGNKDETIQESMMARFDGMELVILGLALCLVIPLLGSYMAMVFDHPSPLLKRSLGWLENGIYRICGINSTQEMNWKTYAKALLLFNFVGLVVLFFLLMGQSWLPFNPQHFAGMKWPLAFNTAVSFVTNTNWQVYEGENSLSYFSQAFGLTVQNFVSAASGNGVLLALIRGIKRRSTTFIGNFWTDLTRTVVYLLLPLSFILALALVSQGVIQNFQPYQEATMWEKGTQILPMGPVASQEAIKQLGSNGGGVFNTNSAHPFENPTQLSNFLELLAILCIPAASLYMFGLMIGSKQQGLILLGVMTGLWIIALAVGLYAEWSPNPVLEYTPVLEGKEARLGVTNSVLWSISTTAVANGSVNSMLDSLAPLTGGMALFQILLGETIFGGIGVGLCGMLMYVLLTVFLAGLMVGRSPEYLGKKIEKQEIQWAMVSILVPCALTLLGVSLALLIPSALASMGNAGPHGLSEMLYAFASTVGNNGSGFEGISANNNFFNILLGLIMLAGRLAILIPSLAIAGSLANKKAVAESLGTFRTSTLLFGVLLTSVILIVAALTFFPALALGPIVEHFLMEQGQAF